VIEVDLAGFMQSKSHFPVKFLDRKVAADLRAAD